LYHNMKYGLVASKELAEFLRERYALLFTIMYFWLVKMFRYISFVRYFEM